MTVILHNASTRDKHYRGTVTLINLKREGEMKYQAIDLTIYQIDGVYHYFNNKVHGCDRRYYRGRLFKHYHQKNQLIHKVQYVWTIVDSKRSLIAKDVYNNGFISRKIRKLNYINRGGGLTSSPQLEFLERIDETSTAFFQINREYY